MNRYQFLFFFLAACAPALAVGQTVTADVARNGSGDPMLDVNGDWVWQVFYNSDLDGGAAAIELGMNFGGSDVISGSVTLTGEGGGDVELSNPGNIVFGWEILNSNGFPEGLQVDPSQGTHGQAFYAHGTGIIAGSTSLLLATFTTVGPSHIGSLTSSIEILGAYNENASLVGIGGTHGIVGQSSGATAVRDVASISALPGDVNLDGMVDADDLAIVDANLGQMLAGGWAVGDLNRSGLVDASDRRIVRGQIPEPGCLCLLTMAAAPLAFGRRRR